MKSSVDKPKSIASPSQNDTDKSSIPSPAPKSYIKLPNFPNWQGDFSEYINNVPNVSGSEKILLQTIQDNRSHPVFLPESAIDFGRIRSTCAIALHMHQPLIPAGGGDLQTAEIISNLKYMWDNQYIGDNHNAPVFHWCYKRIGEFIPQLVNEGKQPRIMLEYSGTLLHGLRQMGLHDVLDNLKTITLDHNYRRAVEWLGCPWGHAVAPSTPVQDYRLHVLAWQHHFAAIFGLEALSRVRGFSPSEMALPNHPDVAYEFVKTLKECGYQWVLVQEHSVEQPENGRTPDRQHIPHRLTCTNSHGETISIIAIIKTQGSDTKLVAQMQPFYEARDLQRWELAGKQIPPIVTQIADGENGGVMMNEFPHKFFEVVNDCSGSDTPLMNATEYLEHLFAMGIKEKDLPVIQPVKQKHLWDRFTPGDGPEKMEQVIEAVKKEEHQFHMDGGSWTNDISWVKGYENVLGPMDKISSLFNEKALKAQIPTNEHRYRNALFHLMASQTSCYRYWGQGLWTDYGQEICRRAGDILKYDF
ncbi:MAG: glycosyl hydrolase family 57 [Gammaproteobacteria bacterium]|nr:MAG: glycosyl hydrolase family 57 [Gammaproteobacteria bacterium]